MSIQIEPMVSVEGTCSQKGHRLLDTRLYPQTWPAVAALVGGFGVLISLTSTTQGLAFGRFDIRGQLCYDERTYFRLDDTGHEWCILFTYPYRLLETSTLSRLLPSLLYVVHQLGQYFIIWQAKQAKQRGEVSWDVNVDQEAVAALQAEGRVVPPADTRPNVYGMRMFALNMGMIVFKFVQSHISYDGLANDVPELSAQLSVNLWFVLSMIIQMPKRGLLFGYWRSFDNRCGIGEDFIEFVRKNHAYAFSFGVAYNFWYHPLEGSPGFILGYVYQFCMILQSAFLFHPFHRNKIWTLVLETAVIPHAVFIAVYLANSTERNLFMFVGGFGWLFITTYMHGLDITFLQKVGFTGLFVAGLLGFWLAYAPDLSFFSDVLMPALFFGPGVVWSVVPCFWLLWVAAVPVCLPFRSINKQCPWTTGVLWFILWAAIVASFYFMGPAGGRGAGGAEVPE